MAESHYTYKDLFEMPLSLSDLYFMMIIPMS